MGLFSFFRKVDKAPQIKKETSELDIQLDGGDSLLVDAAKLVVNYQQGSPSLLQRELKLGYNRASRIINQLEALEVIGPFEDNDTRKVLITDLSSLSSTLIKNRHKLEELDYMFLDELQINQKYLNEISLGICKAELIEIIGEPEKVEENVSPKKKIEKLYYGGDLNRMGSISYSRMIKLENDKVVGWKDL